MLHQLVVAGEGLETLLTLMRLHLGSASDTFSAKLHCRLCHQILNKIKLVMKKKTCVLFSVDGQDLCFMLKTPSEKSPGHKISSEYGEAGCSKYSLTRGPSLTLV